MHTVADAQSALEDKLTPTLRRDIEGVLEKLYADGRRRAALSLGAYGEHDAAQAFPAKCPYSLDEICQQDWYPDSAEK